MSIGLGFWCRAIPESHGLLGNLRRFAELYWKYRVPCKSGPSSDIPDSKFTHEPVRLPVGHNHRIPIVTRVAGLRTVDPRSPDLDISHGNIVVLAECRACGFGRRPRGGDENAYKCVLDSLPHSYLGPSLTKDCYTSKPSPSNTNNLPNQISQQRQTTGAKMQFAAILVVFLPAMAAASALPDLPIEDAQATNPKSNALCPAIDRRACPKSTDGVQRCLFMYARLHGPGLPEIQVT